MKKIIISAVVILALIGGYFVLDKAIIRIPRGGDETPEAPKLAGYKNDATYNIEGKTVKIDGVTTKYFGNELKRDLDGDGREDVVFLLTHEPGGSGTFFYVVAALNTGQGWKGSQGLFLGDRIAPQTTELSQNPTHKDVIIVNYADRAKGEPMTARPSMGKSIWIKLDPAIMQFGEVVQNFEGESR